MLSNRWIVRGFHLIPFIRPSDGPPTIMSGRLGTMYILYFFLLAVITIIYFQMPWVHGMRYRSGLYPVIERRRRVYCVVHTCTEGMGRTLMDEPGTM